MVLLFFVKILFISLLLWQLLITLYYRCYSLALLVLIFNYNRLLGTIYTPNTKSNKPVLIFISSSYL